MTHDEILKILRGATTVAVVGISDRADRPSYRVATYLCRYYDIIPVNPNFPSWEGKTCYRSISEIPVHVHIDIVDVFRRTEEIPRIVESAIARRVGCVWMQQGLVHDDAAWEAEQAGLFVVMDRCLAVEHQRLIGR